MVTDGENVFGNVQFRVKTFNMGWRLSIEDGFCLVHITQERQELGCLIITLHVCMYSKDVRRTPL